MSAPKANQGQHVALFGGTFDPIHNGHLRLALDVLELGFDEVRLIPNAVPPHREQPGAASEQRKAMLAAAVAGEARLVVDCIELENPSSQSYSFNTLELLRARDEQSGVKRRYTWILGSDAFLGLDQWYRWQDFVSEINLLVIERPGYPLPTSGPVHDWYQGAKVADIAELMASERGACYSSDLRVLAISATEIRKRVAEGHSPRYLIPEAVLKIIGEHQLYRR